MGRELEEKESAVFRCKSVVNGPHTEVYGQHWSRLIIITKTKKENKVDGQRDESGSGQS